MLIWMLIFFTRSHKVYSLLFTHTHMYTHAYTHIHTHTHTYTHTCIHMHTHTYTHMHTHTHACMRVCNEIKSKTTIRLTENLLLWHFVLQEERFLFPIYPLFCLSAALSVQLLPVRREVISVW